MTVSPKNIYSYNLEILYQSKYYMNGKSICYNLWSKIKLKLYNYTIN